MFLASKFASPSKSTNLLIPLGLAPIVVLVGVAGGVDVVVVLIGTSAPPDELPDDELAPVSGSIPPDEELPPPPAGSLLGWSGSIIQVPSSIVALGL